ncbi:hypothetical protein CTI12_AA100430 [Artemisia annua]|uniref:Uncharacterized protein n=1 Tax=Artemisia annua TaxID=35608 RepID=A0A2U1PXL0_ARTAN|nr:hypothetical protein CTI12_AA100430 [Artemisia annua]
MAFSPYKRAPRLLSLFNVGPLDLPQELVDAAKSFTLFLSPSDEASVTKSSVINQTALPIRFNAD